jgi:uncharacterized membrane protein
MKIHSVYLLICLVFGLLLMVAMPPFQVVDEIAHFWRGYQVSDGGFIAERRGDQSGGEIPRSVFRVAIKACQRLPGHLDKKADVPELLSLFSVPLNREDRRFASFPNTVLYSPVPYVPQAVGIAIGKVFDATPLVLMYLGRLANLLCAAFCVWLAIRITPVFKHVFLLLGLTPMCVHQFASLAADGLTIGLGFLLTAAFLRLAADDKTVLDVKTAALLIAGSCLLALCKSVYFPMVLLYFIIPPARAKTRTPYYAIGAILLAVVLGASFLWGRVGSRLFVALQEHSEPTLGPGVDFVRSHPVQFGMMMLRTLKLQIFFYMRGFIGHLAWRNVHIPVPLVVSYWIVLAAAVMLDGKADFRLSLTGRGLALCAFAACAVLIMLSCYLSWTPLRAYSIHGMHGKYFIPCVPALAVTFYSSKWAGRVPQRWMTWCATGFTALALLIALYTIVSRFYL